MSRAIQWAIRITFVGGRTAFLRRGSLAGKGPIINFASQAAAEAEAVVLRYGLDAEDVVTVVERSHGRPSWPPGPERTR